MFSLPTHPRRHAAYPLVLVLAVLAVLTLGSGPASAHSALKSTSPKASSTVPTLPGEVTLSFNEQPLEPGAVVRVTDPTGAVVSDGKPTIGDRMISQKVKTAQAPAGAYKVSWRVTSEDGHPISGTFGFTTRTAAAAPTAAAPSTTTSPEPTATTGAATPTVTASPTSSPTASAQAAPGSTDGDKGSRTGVLIALGAAVVLVFGGAAALLLARNRRQED
ncbi:copper resistance CopC family protein [Knoellia koreensis]|uniref:Copper resistance protein CopC n=1 Tax=Knoellia koreensis TaxID=2730921 RepID=A0A849HKX5_9MICO|nr:copper resistance CopC family protein [Knoellia sp. DB2414S]NNM47323.1 copper resistance protein CopC [Knoellia sp. DB2414S]